MKIKDLAIVTLFVVMLLSLRFVGLARYPAIHPDEGFWTQGARNWIRYSDPAHDDRLHHFLSPGHFVALCGFFEIAPASLLSARVFSALLGCGTCLVMWRMCRATMPTRTLLPVVLLGGSSMAILAQRQGLLEAHQMFWLVLAAWSWCSAHRLGPVGAGLAVGMALLVKSNSMYLLPVFALAPPIREERYPWRSLSYFGLACIGLAGGGYLLARWLNPEAFAAAFGSELLGQGTEDIATLWNLRFSRFGINPPQVVSELRNLLMVDTLLVVLALAGLIFLLRRLRRTTQVERFFALWLIVGLVFHFSQIRVEYRYLTTLAPACAFLAAVAFIHLAGESQQNRVRQLLTWGLLGLFLAVNVTRLGFGIVRGSNRDYWQTVAYFQDHVPADARALASSHLVQSLPQTGYECFRTLHGYDGKSVPLEDVVGRLRINYIIVDNEWREYNEYCQEYLERNFRSVKTIGDTVRIYEIKAD